LIDITTMEQEKNLIMVTWDFTEKSMFALEHALQISSVLKSEIAVVHIVKKDSEIKEAEKKMAVSIQPKFPGRTNDFKYIARAGSIFHTIAEVAAEINALMVIMGAHGIMGMQKFLGSWALKVVASSKAPFIVIQEPPQRDSFGKIVLPVSYRREAKECVMWANFFSKRFNTHFIIYKAKYTDKNLHKSVDSNVLFITKYFANKTIHYEIVTAAGEHDFGNEAVSYAKKIDSDAIMLMTTRDIGFADYVLGPQEQYIISNSERIPVIAINPRPAKLGGGFSASGG
ncbi:MAG: universal stress protein, partial [Bacteroidales bacterium]|nr:universal stress protein [Bacteroidales bacterium]